MSNSNHDNLNKLIDRETFLKVFGNLTGYLDKIYVDLDSKNRYYVTETLTFGMAGYLDDEYEGDWISINDLSIVNLTNLILNQNIGFKLKDQELTNKFAEPKLEYKHEEVSFNSKIKMSNVESTSFPVKLMRFLNSFSDLLNAKNKAYGNSALEPTKVFSKASSSQVILQQLDHKLSRIKNSETPIKNDVIDLMGYLTLYCLDQDWIDLTDILH